MTMFKFVTLYRQVDDVEKLESFFANTHLKLAEQLPGLRRKEVSHIRDKPGGKSRFHLMVELYFDSRQDYIDALKTEPGHDLLLALTPWSEAGIITWFYADSYLEDVS